LSTYDKGLFHDGKKKVHLKYILEVDPIMKNILGNWNNQIIIFE